MLRIHSQPLLSGNIEFNVFSMCWNFLSDTLATLSFFLNSKCRTKVCTSTINLVDLVSDHKQLNGLKKLVEPKLYLEALSRELLELCDIFNLIVRNSRYHKLVRCINYQVAVEIDISFHSPVLIWAEWFSQLKEVIIMRNLFVLVVLAIAATHAVPFSRESGKVAPALSGRIDRGMIDAAIEYLEKHGVNGKPLDEATKAKLLNRMLDRHVSLPQAKFLRHARQASETKSVHQPKADLKQKLVRRIAQLKESHKLPANFEMPAKFELPTRKFNIPERAEKAKLRSSFKVPASAQLPEKFQRKLQAKLKM